MVQKFKSNISFTATI